MSAARVTARPEKSGRVFAALRSAPLSPSSDTRRLRRSLARSSIRPAQHHIDELRAVLRGCLDPEERTQIKVVLEAAIAEQIEADILALREREDDGA
jgi:hypothetical protein